MIHQTNPIQTYPSSVQNLNRLTMTVDVDIYDNGTKVEIPAMPEGSPIKVKFISLALTVDARLRRWGWKEKTGLGFFRCQNPTQWGWLRDSNSSRCPLLCFLLTSLFTEEKNATNHLPQDCGQQDLFYHQLANQGLQPIQVRGLIIFNIAFLSTLAIMVKHDKLMMANDCDFIKMVSDIRDRDGGGFLIASS